MPPSVPSAAQRRRSPPRTTPPAAASWEERMRTRPTTPRPSERRDLQQPPVADHHEASLRMGVTPGRERGALDAPGKRATLDWLTAASERW
ncbi:hypothetical protein ZWY2020_015601 [Hordeum vulgare]|nr:hypothetical protein ZWY2020_015601 [Hordeum vulgare]